MSTTEDFLLMPSPYSQKTRQWAQNPSQNSTNTLPERMSVLQALMVEYSNTNSGMSENREYSNLIIEFK